MCNFHPTPTLKVADFLHTLDILMIAFIWYIHYVGISLPMFLTFSETCARPYYEKDHNF